MSQLIHANAEQFNTAVQNGETVLADFSATWCGPCKMLEPIITSFAERNPNITVMKIDVDENNDLAASFQIMSVPTILVFKNGQLVNRQTGVVPIEALENLVL